MGGHLDLAEHHDLAERVFSEPEKWGWEFRQPPPARRSPEWSLEPLWVEPAAPRPAAALRPGAVARRAVTVAVLLVVGLPLLKYGGVILVLLAIVLAAVWFLPMITGAEKARGAQAAFTRRRNAEHARYTDAWQAWQASITSWNAGERARIDAADLWFPVTAAPNTWRIDVFGGTADGWAALVTTLGASLLTADRPVLLLDLSEQDISRELIAMAAARGIPAGILDLPAELGRAALLQGLGPEDVAEIIAEAVSTARETAAADLRALDAALIKAVAGRLDGEITFRKILAGLQVLRRCYDGAAAGQPPLSEAEFRRLAAHVDAAGQDDQAQRELLFLASIVELLADAGDTVPAAFPGTGAGFWQPGVRVLRTGQHNHRRKDLMDRVLVQALLHQLRLQGGRGTPGTLILAGCDHLGLRTLETLGQLARRAGLQTVLVLEHLRGDLQQLLGGSDSASVIMRLGNAQEAAAAAEHIGRGHTFILNQLSRQVSDAHTDGEAKQWGATGNVSDSHSTGGGQSRHWSRSTGFSRSDTWSRTVNWSDTQTRTDGATVSRVYEFAVEPTQIQSMPATAFVFVAASEGRRQVTAGDCNPGISLLDRVAGLAARSPQPPAGNGAAAGSPS